MHALLQSSDDRWQKVLGIHFIIASFIFVHEIIAYTKLCPKSKRIGEVDIYTVFVPYFFKRKN